MVQFKVRERIEDIVSDNLLLDDLANVNWSDLARSIGSGLEEFGLTLYQGTSLLSLSGITFPASHLINYTMKGDPEVAILIADDTQVDLSSKSKVADAYFLRLFENFVTVPYLVLSFLMEGKKVKTFHHATSTDLYEVLKNENILQVALFGHGSPDTWEASDKVVSTKDIKKQKFNPKDFLYKFACGGKPRVYSCRGEVCAVRYDIPAEEIMGKSIVSDPNNMFYYKTVVHQNQIGNTIIKKFYQTLFSTIKQKILG